MTHTIRKRRWTRTTRKWSVFCRARRKTRTRRAEADPLAWQDFGRSNSGYLYKLQYVTGIRDGMAVVGRDSLPISRARKKEFIKAVADYISGI